MVDVEPQIQQCVDLLKAVFQDDVLGIYLYGSAVSSGLQKYSDIDVFVVVNRSTTKEEKQQLIQRLLKISGVYMKDTKPPVELTIVVHADINPWHYPPKFDFQYGDWWRDEFVRGVITPWDSELMPDLAILITQVLLTSKTLFGVPPNELLPHVPSEDIYKAMVDEMPSLVASLESDTRNVLLTLARIWGTLETGEIQSKPEAADWVISRMPDDFQRVLQRAKDIYLNQQDEQWGDLKDTLEPCVTFLVDKIQQVYSAHTSK